ncbi:hypothetical protein PA08_2430 [Cutibacterium modestum P08]|nr:hypothetical protein PA08_2430 [Cutibacterium modestum P08]
MDPEVCGANLEKSKVPLPCRGAGTAAMLILVVLSAAR